MKALRIPFLQTTIIQDLLVTFLLTPLWWLLGVNVFIYQLMAGLIFFKMLTILIYENKPFATNALLAAFALFLLSYLVSVGINKSSYPFQRVLASMNNYSMFVMGFLICLVLYNAAGWDFYEKFFKTARYVGIFTGVIAAVFLAAWYLNLFTIDTQSLLAKVFPSLRGYPFFYILWQVEGVEIDWSLGNLPRFGIYSSVNIATGGFMAMVLPLLIGSFHLRSKPSLWRYPVTVLALIPLIFSLSRTAICSFIAAYCFVKFLEANGKFFMGILILILSAFGGSYLFEGFQWLLQVRGHSTEGRFNIYTAAIRLAMTENPLMGIGIRPREEFSSMIVGSHSHYIELLLVTGILGLFLFLVFQWGLLLTWYQQKKYLKQDTEKIAWKYLGISYVAGNGVLLTSGLSSLPFIAFTFYLIAASILAFSYLLGRGNEMTEKQASL